MRDPVAAAAPSPRLRVPLKTLIGSGDRIAMVTLPVAVVGLAIHAMDPSFFAIDGVSPVVRALAWLALAIGVVAWAWSAALILTKVPKGELITGGPFALVKHPLYTSVGLLVLPAAGILLGSWLGIVIGVTLYLASRSFAPAEEQDLAAAHGPAWDAYGRDVRIPWL